MAMQTFEDDDLNDVKPAAKPQAQAQPAAAAAAAPAPAKAQAQAKAAAPADDFDDEAPKAATKAKAADDDDIHETGFDDEAVLNRPGTLNRVRPEKGYGKAVRFAFIKSVKMKSAKSHFVETGSGKDTKKGTYRCLSHIGDENRGWCCERLDKDSDIHIAALVLVYKNADPQSGKYTKGADGVVPPIEWELGYVDLSGYNLKQIKKLPDEDQDPYDIDIIMSKAENRAFGYEFNRASNKARWLHNAELVKEVEAAAERFRDGKALIGKLGKKLSPLEWKALLAGGSATEEAKLDNMDDL